MNLRMLSRTRILLACSMALIIGSLVGPSAALAVSRPTSPFGVCSHMLWGYSNAEIDREMGALSNAGAKWVRIDVSWRDIETSDGVYNASLLRSLDYVVSSAARRGVRVQAVVMETPGWANGGQSMWAPPTNDAKFGEFMRYMAGRYAGRINYWELGNEVNETEFWNVPRSSSPARYTSFLKAGYVGTKDGNVNALVISAGLAGSDDGYLQEMYDAGAKGFFDLLGVHAYTNGRSPYTVDAITPSSTYGGLAIMKSVMESNGDSGKNIWVTEAGWQTSSVGRCVTPDQQAQYVFEAYERVLQEFPYVETLFVYGLRNNGTSSSSTTDNYGLLNHDYSEKPAYASYRRAADAFTLQLTENTVVDTGTVTEVGTSPETSAAANPDTGAIAVKAKVRPVVTIKASKSRVHRSRRVRLSGKVTAARGSRIALQRKVHGRWKTVRTVKLNRSGRYSLRVKLRHRGTLRFRTVSSRSLRTYASTSRSVRVKVH